MTNQETLMASPLGESCLYIGDATVSIVRGGRVADGRTEWSWRLALGGERASGDGLLNRCGERETMARLLDFMLEVSDYFPDMVRMWIATSRREIAEARAELEVRA